MAPFFSIVTFVKNRSDKIAKCIESIQRQNINNLEMVIQDGSSTDGTKEICEKMAFLDKRIKFVSENDKSPTDAWFKALKRCRGDWIGLLMSDETYCPNALISVKSIIRSQQLSNSSFIYGNGFTVDYEGDLLGEVHADKNFSIERYLLNEVLPHPGNCFINKKILNKAKILNREIHWGCGEYEVFLRLALCANPTHVPIYISNFAVHQNQLGGSVKANREVTESELLLFKKFFGSKEGKKFRHLENQACIGILKRSLTILITKNFLEDSYFYIKEMIKFGHERKKIYDLLYLITKEKIKKNRQESKKIKNKIQSNNKQNFLNTLLAFMGGIVCAKNHNIIILRTVKPILRLLSKL